uniref:Uncharacterized protein n=1 Tax=Arundo donax TaxID=35708 RepID=A0A0A9DV37_ARUDO
MAASNISLGFNNNMSQASWGFLTKRGKKQSTRIPTTHQSNRGDGVIMMRRRRKEFKVGGELTVQYSISSQRTSRAHGEINQ